MLRMQQVIQCHVEQFRHSSSANYLDQIENFVVKKSFVDDPCRQKLSMQNI